MWGLYCDIESNQIMLEPFIFEPFIFEPCPPPLVEESSNTLYYAGIVLMTLTLIPVNLLFR
jgi:hypothetical protein